MGTFEQEPVSTAEFTGLKLFIALMLLNGGVQYLVAKLL